METIATAVQDFRRARNRAALERLISRFTGESTELLAYEEVRQKLRASGVVSKSVREIPISAIVGSVGRYRDFTRTFLPRQDSDENRWASVKVAGADLGGLAPIEVYQIGEVYFVQDGHHRISTARDAGAATIQAYVTEIRSKVPLTPDVKPDDLILKAEYAEFLEQTQLDQSRPQADLSVTVPGQYQQLLEHIEVHRHYMGLEQQREIPYEEAVVHWYDEVYLPVVRLIHERGILYDFPDRRAADLYLWIGRHRTEMQESLGWENVELGTAAVDLADQHGRRPSRILSRIGTQILDVVTPNELEAGPPPGTWRRERLAMRYDERLFADIMVPVNGQEEGWWALEQAIEIARRESGWLRGLHVVPDESYLDEPEVQKVRDHFRWRLGEVGLPGDLVIDTGPVVRTIFERARWTDLLVVRLLHPPGDKPLTRLSSPFRTLIRHSPRPVLAVPGQPTALRKALLAYDGRPKSQEALFVATYLAAHWELPLVVVTVASKNVDGEQVQREARRYVAEFGVTATWICQDGEPAEVLQTQAGVHDCDWLIMGGYGGNPVLEVVLGSVVGQILRESARPTLICQ